MKVFLFEITVAVCVIFIAFFVGRNSGVDACIGQSSALATQQQSDLINLERGIDEEIFHAATDDIRHSLREKYTIAE